MDGLRTATAAANDARRLWARLRTRLGGDPSLLIVAVRAHADALAQAKELGALAEAHGCACVGATSALGALDAEGFHHAALAAFAVRDPRGAYGTWVGQEVEAVVDAACEAAGRPGEKPTAVLLLATPGEEERWLQGLAKLLGGDVPVVGGGAADDEVKGAWHVLAGARMASQGAALAALFPSVPVETAFISSYAPAGPSAVATRVKGRTLLELDGRPAAKVYDRWLDGALAGLRTRREVLAATTFTPLGMRVETLAGAAVHLLLHPTAATREGGVELFAAPQEGAEIALMRAEAEDVLARPALAVEGALARRGWRADCVRGAWFAFCAGCMFGVQARMQEAGRYLQEVLGGAPFQLMFTFGEVGCFVDGENRHGNLMVSMLLFGEPC